MGRRSRHTPEELRKLAIRSAHQIIAEDGLAGVSARAVARRIGYSAGALYNIFGSLDELVLEVEVLLLDALDHRLSEVPTEGSPRRQLKDLAHAYLRFSREHPRVWSLIAQHDIPTEGDVPEWYSERLERILDRFERALAGQVPSVDKNPQSLARSARVVWAALHGISLMSTTEKLSGMPNASMDVMVDDLIETYMAGLRARTGSESS